MQSGIPSHADFVVIGGGIIGLSIAWQLASRRAGRVVLLERAVIGAGASGRTGALLRQHYTNVPEATLAARSLDVFAHWNDVLGGSCGFVPSGLIVTVPTNGAAAANLGRMRDTVSQLKSLGVGIELLTSDELQAVDPAARFDDISHATFESRSGFVDAVAATTTLAVAAARAGVEIHESTSVERILSGDQGVTGISTSRGAIATERVILANGPWAVALAATAGINLPITALRVQIAIFQHPSQARSSQRAYVDNAAGIFCRPWGPGRTMVGLGGGDQHDPVEPDDFDPRNDLPYPGQARRAMSKRFPAFAHAVYLHGHAGLYDMTPDAHPLIGLTGVDGISVAAGFSGAGFKKGPAVGEAMADLLLNGDVPWVELERFSIDRFRTEGWQRPWSPNEYDLGTDFGHGL